MTTIISKEEIMRVLPHRDPFLFVDEVTDIGDTHITAHYTFAHDNGLFKAHFPGNPIVPGVLLVEAMAQAGGYLLLSQPENRDKNALMVSLKNARFREIVRPGDKITMHIEKKYVMLNTAACNATTMVDGKTACTCEIMCAIVDR